MSETNPLPMADSSLGATPAKKPNRPLIIGAIIGGVFLVGLLCCGVSILVLAIVMAGGRGKDSERQPQPAAQVPNKSDWKEFTSKEDGFVVSFPTALETLSQDNQYNFGKVTIRAYTSNPGGKVVWRVAVHNYPEPFASQVKPEKLIELMRDGMAANVKGKVEEVKEVELDGYAGQEFLVHSPDPLTNKPLTTKVRLFAVGGRVFQVAAIAPLNDEALGEEASRFFKSFRLLKK